MKKLSIILTVLLLFTLPSCANKDMPPCREILEEITQAEIGLPTGRIYSLDAEKGDSEYLPDSLINVLYGSGSHPAMADGWLDASIFLSSPSHPCEFAVFLCNSEDTADDTARMLCRRLDLLQSAKGDGAFGHYFDSATVTVMRNYVLLIISSDTETALKVAAKIIR